MATKTVTRYRTRFVSKPRRRAKSLTLPIAPLAGLAVGMWPVVKWAMEGRYENARTTLIYNYLPYNPWDNKFDISGLKNGLVPLVGGMLVHNLVGGKLGVNRALAKAGVPLIRI